MRRRMGRKALILLTDGVDNGSKVSLPEAIESAQRTDTLVYSILFTGEEQQPSQPFGGGGYGGRRRGGGFPPPQAQRPDGKKILQQMSRETGGGFFEVSHKMSIDQIYDRIEEELRGTSIQSWVHARQHEITLGSPPHQAVTIKQRA